MSTSNYRAFGPMYGALATALVRTVRAQSGKEGRLEGSGSGLSSIRGARGREDLPQGDG